MIKKEFENEEHKKLLFTLLSTNYDRVIWDKNVTFELPNKKTVSLESSIIFLKNENTYKVINNATGIKPIFSNHKVSVYNIKASFKLSSAGKIEYLNNPPEIIKIIIKSKKYSHEKFIDKINYEYNHSKKITHLEIKYNLYFTQNQGYIIMKKMPGMTLFDFIGKIQKKKIFAQYFIEISYAILLNFIYQIRDYGLLLHLDIKPENMFFDMNNKGGIKINFIDYAYSAYDNDIANLSSRGTENFISPEIDKNLTFYIQNHATLKQKPDIFSAGITLQNLWLVFNSLGQKKNLDAKELDFFYYKLINQYKYQISKEIFYQIILLSINMTEFDPISRYSLEESLSIFEEILQNACIDPDDIHIAIHGYERPIREIYPIHSVGSLKNPSGKYKFFDVLRPNNSFFENNFYKNTECLKPNSVTENHDNIKTPPTSKLFFQKCDETLNLKNCDTLIDKYNKIVEKVSNQKNHFWIPLHPTPLKNRSGNIGFNRTNKNIDQSGSSNYLSSRQIHK